jgi:hypothetical protein
MRLTEYLISEARKNPGVNLKNSMTAQLIDISKDHPNAYLTFTEIPKFGANPQSKWNTPLGICAYPISYVIGVNGNVPFASEQPYIFVFESKSSSNFLDLSEENEDDEEDQENIKRGVELILPGHSVYDNGYYTYKMMWHEMYNAIHRYITKTTDGYYPPGDRTGPYSTLARRILMTAGYDGVIDPGYGIIHPSEPTQSIFFNIKKLNVITMIVNKQYTPISKEYQTRITTKDQWRHRILHAIEVRRRDRDLEKCVNSVHDRYTHITPNTTLLVSYAKAVRQRVPAFEPHILAEDTGYMISYAEYVIKGRWPEAEPLIMKYAQDAVDYAIRVIKGRWPEAEQTINRMTIDRRVYNQFLDSLKLTSPKK